MLDLADSCSFCIETMAAEGDTSLTESHRVRLQLTLLCFEVTHDSWLFGIINKPYVLNCLHLKFCKVIRIGSCLFNLWVHNVRKANLLAHDLLEGRRRGEWGVRFHIALDYECFNFDYKELITCRVRYFFTLRHS